MGRVKYALILGGLLIFALLLTFPLMTTPLEAQPPFAVTGTPGGFPGGGGLPPGFPGTGQDGTTPQAPFPPPVDQQPPAQEQPPVQPEVTPEVVPVSPEATAQPTPIIDEVLQIAFNARLDLELLTDVTLGTRPEGWSGVSDINNPELALLTRIDLELLAGSLLGAEVRPAGWFGPVGSTRRAIARDLRHDLELLADQYSRPAGWIGSEPLMRCDRSTQAIVEFLERNGVFVLQADRTAPDFCQQAALEASLFMEVNLLENAGDGTMLMRTEGGVTITNASATINSTFAAAFLDRAASQRVGVVPEGTAIEAVGRSAVQFSNMMLIRGDGFEVFVDFQFTSITQDQFNALPDIDTLTYQPACTAAWCNNS